MLAWTQQNTMQRAMRTVLEWPQSHAISKTIKLKYYMNGGSGGVGRGASPKEPIYILTVLPGSLKLRACSLAPLK